MIRVMVMVRFGRVGGLGLVSRAGKRVTVMVLRAQNELCRKPNLFVSERLTADLFPMRNLIIGAL